MRLKIVFVIRAGLQALAQAQSPAGKVRREFRPPNQRPRPVACAAKVKGMLRRRPRAI
jgi:hypothetical protein